MMLTLSQFPKRIKHVLLLLVLFQLQAIRLSALAVEVLMDDYQIFDVNGEGEDWFGQSVAVYGDTIVIGASGRDRRGPLSGSVFLFSISSKLLEEHTPKEVTSGDRFGRSVGICENGIIVGAHRDSEKQPEQGSAYVWSLAPLKDAPVELNAPEKKWLEDGRNGDDYGLASAISDRHVIVGAKQRDSLNKENSGAAYLYKRDTPNGLNLVSDLTLPTPSEGDEFGFAVAVNQDLVIVGAPYDNDSGSVHIFALDDPSSPPKSLQVNVVMPGDRFGLAVAISEEYIVVGAPLTDTDKGEDSGVAYVFDVDGTFRAKIVADDGSAFDELGHSVAVHGGVVVVGAPKADVKQVDSGAAYLFDVNTEKQVKLVASNGQPEDQFGHAVAVHTSGSDSSAETNVVIGAWLHDKKSCNSGAVYLYSNPKVPSH